MAPRHQPTIGLVLGSGGPDASAAHLPAIESVLAAAGYRLLLIVLPVDSGAARDRVNALLSDGVTGLLCAPGAIAIAIQAVSGSCPVVALGQWAGETILKSLGIPIPAEPKLAFVLSAVVAAVPGGTDPASSTPVSEPAVTPAPISILNNPTTQQLPPPRNQNIHS